MTLTPSEIVEALAAARPMVAVNTQAQSDPYMVCALCSGFIGAPEGIAAAAGGRVDHSETCPWAMASDYIAALKVNQEDQMQSTDVENYKRMVRPFLASVLVDFDMTRVLDSALDSLARNGRPTDGWLIVPSDDAGVIYVSAAESLGMVVDVASMMHDSCAVIAVSRVAGGVDGLVDHGHPDGDVCDDPHCFQAWEMYPT